MVFFNVYIEHSENEKIYIIVLNEEQIKNLVMAFLRGEDTIRIKGVERNIRNPKKFIIYSITNLLTLGTEQADIEANLRKHARFEPGGKISLKFFSQFGTNVTDRLTGCLDWGSKRNGKINREVEVNQNQKDGKVFISHSSKDKVIVDKFIDYILVLGLGVIRSNIFCTSSDGTKIKSGTQFKETIKSELLKSTAVFQIITRNYKESEVCLNEMGAAWVISENVIPLIASPFNYDVGFIHSGTQQVMLNNKNDLLKLYDDHKNTLFNNEVNFSNFNTKVEEFVDYINNIQNG